MPGCLGNRSGLQADVRRRLQPFAQPLAASGTRAASAHIITPPPKQAFRVTVLRQSIRAPGRRVKIVANEITCEDSGWTRDWALCAIDTRAANGAPAPGGAQAAAGAAGTESRLEGNHGGTGALKHPIAQGRASKSVHACLTGPTAHPNSCTRPYLSPGPAWHAACWELPGSCQRSVHSTAFQAPHGTIAGLAMHASLRYAVTVCRAQALTATMVATVVSSNSTPIPWTPRCTLMPAAVTDLRDSVSCGGRRRATLVVDVRERCHSVPSKAQVVVVSARTHMQRCHAGSP